MTVHADDSVVEAPPPALERAISNLVDNAAKFDTGGGPIEIEVTAGRLVVHDHGPGIAPADAGRVFDRFYRADGARSMPGSGLGLSIVRDVVERNGGRVEAASRPGGGATVGFTLPLVSGTGASPAGPPGVETRPSEPAGTRDDASWSPPVGLGPPPT